MLRVHERGPPYRVEGWEDPGIGRKPRQGGRANRCCFSIIRILYEAARMVAAQLRIPGLIPEANHNVPLTGRLVGTAPNERANRKFESALSKSGPCLNRPSAELLENRIQKLPPESNTNRTHSAECWGRVSEYLSD